MEIEQHATVFRIFLPFETGQRSEGDYLPQCFSGCSATSTLRSDRVECLGRLPVRSEIAISTEKRACVHEWSSFRLVCNSETDIQPVLRRLLDPLDRGA